MSTSAGIQWAFTSIVGEGRSSQLLAWRSFNQIVEQFASCSIGPLHWEKASAPHLDGCHRSSHELSVDPDLFDAFFNAPVGYRGQFAESETNGAAANRCLIDSLFLRLLAADAHSPVDPELVKASLRGKQAKVWIVESAVEDQLTAPEKSIVFPEWEFNEPDGQGLRAPRGTLLEVKGGWLEQSGREVINPAKCQRSRNIYRTGDSK